MGFANLPKQWHRKSIKRGFTFNIMIAGESSLGKKTLINTLFNKEILPSDPEENELGGDPEERESEAGGEVNNESNNSVRVRNSTTDLEEDGIRLKLSVVSTPGFGDALNNTDFWKPIVNEIDYRFDTYLDAESRINRSSVVDNRIHAFLYFIEPTGHALRDLDILTMKTVHEKVNLIPVISKSDTLTEEEIEQFKERILKDIAYHGIKVFQPVQHQSDDDEIRLGTQKIMSKLPFAIVGSNEEVNTPDGRSVRGRLYPWGLVEVDNEDHCDFIALRQLLVRNFMEELRETTGNILYERYRTQKLLRMGIEQDDYVFKEFDPLSKQEEEKALHEAKLAKMEAEMKAVFQQKVSEKEKKLQRSEADLFSRHKEMKEKLSKQIKLLEEKKQQLEKQKSLPQEPQPAPKSKKGFLR